MAVFSILLAAAAQATSQCAGDAVTRPLIFIIQADNDRDLASVMNFYSSDPVFLSPTMPPLRGRKAIRDSYVAMYGEFDPHLTISFDSVSLGNAAAKISGKTGGWLDSRKGGGRQPVNDHFEALMLCVGTSWKVATLRWWPVEAGSNRAQ